MWRQISAGMLSVAIFTAPAKAEVNCSFQPTMVEYVGCEQIKLMKTARSLQPEAVDVWFRYGVGQRYLASLVDAGTLSMDGYRELNQHLLDEASAEAIRRMQKQQRMTKK